MPTASGPLPHAPEARDAAGGPDAADEAVAPRLEGYEVIGRLGQGGMGIVWRALQLGTRREVALKILGPALFGSSRARRRFEREVELSARLEHPNIARVYQSGLNQGVYFYAMELVHGGRLDDHVREKGLGTREILELVRTICQAVQYAHQSGVIHRDLKPSNIVVDAQGNPKVLDFGLAKALLQEDDGPEVSRDGEIAGTPAYMSPEQAAGGRLDTRTDVYSLGVILFRLLTGKSPHDLSGSNLEVMRRISELEPLRPRRAAPKLDRELESLLLKALAREPDRRYASAGELAKDIAAYLAGEPLVAKPPTTAYFLKKRIRKHWRPLVVAAIGIAMIIAALVYQAVRESAQRRSHLNDLEAQIAIADIERGDADGTGDAWHEAIHTYGTARDRLLGAGRSSLPADLAFWSAARAAPPSLITIPRTGGATAVAMFPDGRRCASATPDGAIQIYDIRTGRPLGRPLKGHTGVIHAIDVSRDGTKILSAGADGSVRLWTLTNSGDAVQRVLKSTSPSPVRAAAFCMDGPRQAVSGNEDGTLDCWDLEPGKGQRRRIPPDPADASKAGAITHVALLPGGKEAVSLSTIRRIQVWNVADGTSRELKLFVRPGCEHFAMSPDGKQLLVEAENDALALMPLGEGQQRRHLMDRSHNPAATCFAYTGRDEKAEVLVGFENGDVKLWRPWTLQLERAFIEHTGPVRAIAFSPEVQGDPAGSRFVVSAAADGLRVWPNGEGREVLTTARAESWQARRLVFSPDGSLVLGTSDTGAAKLVDVLTGQFIRDIEAANGVFTFGPGLQVRVFIPPEGAPTQREPYPPPGGFLPDGKTVVCVGSDGKLRVYDVTAMRAPTKWAGLGPTTGAAGTAAAVPAPIRTLGSHAGHVLSFALSRGGRRAATADDIRLAGSYPIRVWNPQSTDSVLQLNGHTAPVRALAFSPADDNCLYSGGDDGTVRKWNPATGKQERLIGADLGPVEAIAVNGSGKLAVIVPQGTVAQLWDLDENRRLRLLIGHGQPVTAAGFAPIRGRDVAVTCDGGGFMKIWDFSRGRDYYDRRDQPAAALESLGQAATNEGLLKLADWYAFRGMPDWSVDLIRRARADGASGADATLLAESAAATGARAAAAGDGAAAAAYRATARHEFEALHAAGSDPLFAYRLEELGGTGAGTVVRGPPHEFMSADLAPALPLGVNVLQPPAAAGSGGTPPRVIDLLAHFDPVIQLPAHLGQWRLRDGELRSPSDAEGGALEFPYRPPPAYDLRVEFTRLGGNDAILMLGSQPDHPNVQFNWVTGGWKNSVMGFQTINGLNAALNPSTLRNSAWVTNGRRYSVVLKVRPGGVSAVVNGTPVSSWPRSGYGEFADFADPNILKRPMHLSPGPKGEDGRTRFQTIGLGTFHSPTIFHRVELVEWGGTGGPLSRAEAPPPEPFPTDRLAGQLAARAWERSTTAAGDVGRGALESAPSAAAPGLLVGFRVTTPADGQLIASVQPLFAPIRPDGFTGPSFDGQTIGSPGPVTVELRAPPGYVVAGLRAELEGAASGSRASNASPASARLAGFRAIYQRLTGMRLDRASERVSDWVGGRAVDGGAVVIGNRGRLVCGAFAAPAAQAGPGIQGLGLLQLAANDGPREIDLLSRIDPVKNVVRAGDAERTPVPWSRLQGGSLASPAGGKNLIEVPCQPPDAYTYEVEFEAPLSGEVAQSLYAGGRAFRWVMSTRLGCGFELDNDRLFDQSGDPMPLFERIRGSITPGATYRSTVLVNANEVEAVVSELRPKAAPKVLILRKVGLSQLKQQDKRKLAHDTWLGLGVSDGSAVFAKVKLTEPADVRPATTNTTTNATTKPTSLPTTLIAK